MRPIKHRYYIESTDPLIGFMSDKGTPMIMPLRFTQFRRRRLQTSITLKTKEDVRIFMKETHD